MVPREEGGGFGEETGDERKEMVESIRRTSAPLGIETVMTLPVLSDSSVVLRPSRCFCF